MNYPMHRQLNLKPMRFACSLVLLLAVSVSAQQRSPYEAFGLTGATGASAPKTFTSYPAPDAAYVTDNTNLFGMEAGIEVVALVALGKATPVEFDLMSLVLKYWQWLALLIGIPLVSTVAYSLYKNGKRGWGWVVAGLLIVMILLIMQFIFSCFQLMNKIPTQDTRDSFGGTSDRWWNSGGGATGSW